jgi:hypothetical protein
MHRFDFPRIPSSEITPEQVYLQRRKFLAMAALSPLALNIAPADARPLDARSSLSAKMLSRTEDAHYTLAIFFVNTFC